MVAVGSIYRTPLRRLARVEADHGAHLALTYLPDRGDPFDDARHHGLVLRRDFVLEHCALVSRPYYTQEGADATR